MPSPGGADTPSPCCCGTPGPATNNRAAPAPSAAGTWARAAKPQRGGKGPRPLAPSPHPRPGRAHGVGGCRIPPPTPPDRFLRQGRGRKELSTNLCKRSKLAARGFTRRSSSSSSPRGATGRCTPRGGCHGLGAPRTPSLPRGTARHPAPRSTRTPGAPHPSPSRAPASRDTPRPSPSRAPAPRGTPHPSPGLPGAQGGPAPGSGAWGRFGAGEPLAAPRGAEPRVGGRTGALHGGRGARFDVMEGRP